MIPFTPEQAKQLHAILAHWPKLGADNDAITLVFPGTGLRLTDKAGTVHLLPGVRSTLPMGVTVNRHYLADAIALGTPVLRLESQESALEFRTGTARVIVMPMKGIPIAIPEDTALAAAEKEWMDCIVKLPPNGTGKVLSFRRVGSQLLATVEDGKHKCEMAVTLLKFHDRPAKQAA